MTIRVKGLSLLIVAVAVNLEESDLPDARTGSAREQGRIRGKRPLELLGLGFGHRRAAVAIDAAGPAADGIVAAKVLGDDLRRDQDVPYLNNR